MAAQNIVTLTNENFAKEVLQSTTPVLVDFWGEWCPPCKALSPILDELAQEYDGKVKIAKVNTNEQPDLATQFRISAVPTLLLFKRGQVDKQMVGLQSKSKLKEAFDSVAA